MCWFECFMENNWEIFTGQSCYRFIVKGLTARGNAGGCHVASGAVASRTRAGPAGQLVAVLLWSSSLPGEEPPRGRLELFTGQHEMLSGRLELFYWSKWWSKRLIVKHRLRAAARPICDCVLLRRNIWCYYNEREAAARERPAAAIFM